MKQTENKNRFRLGGQFESMGEIELVLKSPTDRIAPFALTCAIDWSVARLKWRISVAYPSRPLVEHQRIVYCGKLLKDDQILRDIFEEGSSTVVHLISQASVPGGGEQSAAVRENETHSEAAAAASGGADRDQLEREYRAYVSRFYEENGASMAAAMMGAHQQLWWSQFYYQNCLNYFPGGFYNPMVTAPTGGVPDYGGSVTGTRDTDNNGDDGNVQDNNQRAPGVQAGGQEPPMVAGGGGVAGAVNNNPNRAGRGDGGMQNMMAAAFGGLMGDGAADDDNDGGEAEPRDALHYFYLLVRLGLLLLICYYYSSAASVATTLLLFCVFVGVNLVRRHNPANRQLNNPPAQGQGEGQRQEQGETGTGTPGDRGVSVDCGSNGERVDEAGTEATETGETSVRERTRARQEHQETSDSRDTGPAPAPVTVEAVSSLAERLRQAASTSLQFVVTFFVTLFPEPIAHIDIN